MIMGQKGTGKTKQLIELVGEAIENEKGSVVCIERGNKLTYDINYKARLIDSSHYQIEDYSMLKGFICGLYAGNYDISHIFIDSLYKVANCDDVEQIAPFIEWLEEFKNENGVSFTVTVSAPVELAPERVAKHF
ncbi:hypothetical protein LJC34_02125 [Oscillospiraceae bacterium OttesenSCG-928-G22]|nr:hypothetical protein [Oscillospiraceae bacterium OttesenSCG-928-G22]